MSGKTVFGQDYTYTGHRVRVNAIAGEVTEGRGEVRKGTMFRSPARTNVILNRKDGRLSSITVLTHDGVRVCKVSPDSIIL